MIFPLDIASGFRIKLYALPSRLSVPRLSWGLTLISVQGFAAYARNSMHTVTESGLEVDRVRMLVYGNHAGTASHAAHWPNEPYSICDLLLIASLETTDRALNDSVPVAWSSQSAEPYLTSCKISIKRKLPPLPQANSTCALSSTCHLFAFYQFG